MNTKITGLFNIQYPIIQAGMVWCSGWELASAVSNAGGLGLIGSGSMKPEVLRHHIRKTREHTNKPFGVNVPLLYSRVDEIMQVIVEEKVAIVFTSAGNPATWTKHLKEHYCLVAHVVSNVKFALKAQEAGVDALVAEGIEAGGHNGKEETTSMVLIPLIRQAISLPLIAAGGIATGQAMLAAMALGADGVQVGSRFVASEESSAHENFKKLIIDTGDGGTQLALRKLNPVRLIKNNFYKQIEEFENRCSSNEELKEFLGKGRSRLGMFEGDLNEGELEIGQVAAGIKEINTAEMIVKQFINEFKVRLGTINEMYHEKD